MILALGSVRNVLGKPSRDELILRIHAQKVETLERSKLLGKRQHFVFQIFSARLSIFGVFVSVRVKLVSQKNTKKHKSTTDGKEDDHHQTNNTTLLRVDACQHGHLKVVE